jgi:hypothetical protein
MSLKKTGVTADTFERLLYDSGMAYVNYGLGTQRLIGATNGGNKIDIIPAIRKMPFDGITDIDVIGDKRMTGVSVKLTLNISEWSTNNVLAALPGAASATGATHDVITRIRQIASTDYFTNIAIVYEKSGTSELFIVKISNAMALNGLSLDGKDNAEAVNTIEFTAHYSTTDLATEPWSISNPLETGSGVYTLTYLAGANGSIIGNPSQNVADGEDGASVYAAPDALYEFSQWSDASTDNPRQDTAVSADVTVTASFTLA